VSAHRYAAEVAAEVRALERAAAAATPLAWNLSEAFLAVAPGLRIVNRAGSAACRLHTAMVRAIDSRVDVSGGTALLAAAVLELAMEDERRARWRT
jgi:hypothetical protein